jgi:hypothetical protein
MSHHSKRLRGVEFTFLEVNNKTIVIQLSKALFKGLFLLIRNMRNGR